MLSPYFKEKDIIIYHGNCLKILPQLEFELKSMDLVLTDPPYDDYHLELYKQIPLDFLNTLNCKQLVFWSAKTDFPLSYTAIHIWNKKTGCGSQYERIFERNGSKNYRVYNEYLINSTVAASYCRDIFTGHPSQKPKRLIKNLISNARLILDPFVGSGTTLIAAKELERRAIGIEIEEKNCEIAAKRILKYTVGQGIIKNPLKKVGLFY